MSTDTINSAIKAIQDIVGRVAGVDSAPEYASDKVPPGVWAMAFPLDGAFTHEPAGSLQGLHNIGLYICCPRVNLPNTLERLYPLAEKVVGALESSPTLLDTVQTFGPITYTFDTAINVGTASAPAYVSGWIFTITGVKLHHDSIISL